MNILVLNSGSSSQKSSLYALENTLPADPPEPLWAANVEWSSDSAAITLRQGGKSARSDIKVTSRQHATEQLLQTLWQGENPAVKAPSDIHAVGHRVVHGGPRYRQPV